MTDHYIQLEPDGSRLGTWAFEDLECFRIDTLPGRGGIYHFKVGEGEDLWALLGEKCSWFKDGPGATFHKLNLMAGQYHPRMARPLEPGPDGGAGTCPGEDQDRNAIAKARGQLAVLTRALEELCQTVHPEGANLQTFGHDIRNLLILACTEVEAHWRGVLQANGQVLERPNTGDYVKLCRPMRLGDYAVSIAAFPWLDPIAPFRGWGSTGKPSQELAWYQGYNLTKHDRDGNFGEATLQRALEAVCANVIMAVAQYGLERALGDGSLLIANYVLAAGPVWTPDEAYTPPYDQPGWQPVKCAF